MRLLSTSLLIIAAILPSSARDLVGRGTNLRGKQTSYARKVDPNILLDDHSVNGRTIPTVSTTTTQRHTQKNTKASKKYTGQDSATQTRIVEDDDKLVGKEVVGKEAKNGKWQAAKEKKETNKSEKSEKMQKNKGSFKCGTQKSQKKLFGTVLDTFTGSLGCNDKEYKTKESTPLVIDDLTETNNAIPLTIVSFTSPANGDLVQQDDGSFIYTPFDGFIGFDSYEYTVVDGLGGSHIGSVSIIVEPLNDSPIASDDIFTVLQGGEVRIDPADILANDVDPEGDKLMIETCTEPLNGQLTIRGGGELRYVPNDDFFGTDNIICTIIDGNGGVDTSTITFNVLASNTDPFTRDDIYVVDMGTTLSVSSPGILRNDEGVEDGLLKVVECADPSRGSLTFDPSGAITYTPTNFFIGLVTVECTIDNGRGGQDTSRIIIAVRPPFFGQGIETDEDAPIILTPSDIIPANTPGATVELCNAPTFGTIVSNGDGTFTFTPSPDYNGNDSFECIIATPDGGRDSVVITILIRPVGDQPLAMPDSFSTTMNSPITFDPVENDIDVDGDNLSVLFVTQPNNGDIGQNPDGTFTYTPNNNFVGTDFADYTVSDGSGGMSTATISIVVNLPLGGPNSPPVAMDDAYFAIENAPLSVAPESGLLSNDDDPDGDIIVVTSFTRPNNGQLTVLQNGGFSYVPDLNFLGVDTFTYIAFDGSDTATASVVITVQPGQSGPVVANDDSYTTPSNSVISATNPGVFENDENVARLVSFTEPVSGGTIIQGTDGSFIYIPPAGFAGTDTYTYTVADTNGNFDTATVTFIVEAMAPTGNREPNAADDSYTGPQNQVLAVNAQDGLLGNDSDPDGDILIVSSFTQPLHGSAAVQQDGSFVYVPDADWFGVDVFDYIIFDGNDVSSASATIVIQNQGPDPIQARDDNFSVPSGTTLTVSVPGIFANDVSANRLVSFTQPEKGGTLVQNGNGSFSYTPPSGFVGKDVYTYRVADTQGNIDFATVTITVTIANIPSLIVPGDGDFIDLNGEGGDAKRVSSDCKGDEFTNCEGVNTVEQEEADPTLTLAKTGGN